MQDLLFQDAEYTLYMYETIMKDFEYSYEPSSNFKQSMGILMYFISYTYI